MHSQAFTFLFLDQITINYYYLQILTSMDSNANATGEAHKKHYENIFMREFAKNGRDSFQVRVTLFDGTPKIGFSRFWHNFQDGDWYPSKDHFSSNPRFGSNR